MNRLLIFILKFFCLIVSFIPLHTALFLGRILGRLVYHVDKKHQRIAINNLIIAFGENREKEEIEKVALNVFENLGMSLMEFCRLFRLKRQDLNRYVTYNGLKYVENARKKGKGVIFLTAHFGNWELLAASFALTGYPLNIIVRKLDSPLLNEFVEDIRTSFGINVIEKRISMRKAIRVLGRGEMIGVLLDQNVTWSEGVFVDYFGRLACTNKGLALLAIRSGAPVIPAFIVREELHKHRVVFEKEMPLTITADRERDIVVNTAKFTSIIERFVRRYPEQWFWVHQRWKSRPENDPRKKERSGELFVQRD